MYNNFVPFYLIKFTKLRFLILIFINLYYLMKKNVLFFGFLSTFFHQRCGTSTDKRYVRCFNDLKSNYQKSLIQKETDLYIWGKGEINTTSVFSNFHPHRIKKYDELQKNPQFIDIVFGEQLAVAIDKNNNLYSWKEPKLNSEKNSNIDNHQRNNILQLAKNYKVIQAAITKDKIFFITKDGGLYFINFKVTIPENKDNYFTIKSNEEKVSIMSDKIIHVKELRNIRSISTGIDHIIALDKDGQIFGMGDDSYGKHIIYD